jgi:hypothetical protein
METLHPLFHRMAKLWALHGTVQITVSFYSTTDALTINDYPV